MEVSQTENVSPNIIPFVEENKYGISSSKTAIANADGDDEMAINDIEQFL